MDTEALYEKVKAAILAARAQGVPLVQRTSGLELFAPLGRIWQRDPSKHGCCAIGCYLLGKPRQDEKPVREAARLLGVSETVIEGLMAGFDTRISKPSPLVDAQAWEIGERLRKEFLEGESPCPV